MPGYKMRLSLSRPHLVTLGVSALIFLLTYSAGGQETATAVAVLEPNKPVERELSGKQKDTYAFDLTADRYLKVVIEQKGIDVIARLVDGEGKRIADFDADMRMAGQEIVEFVNQHPGKYSLTIEPRYELMPGGRYEIRLEELRSANENDRALQKARDLYADSLRQYGAGKYEPALAAVESVIKIRRELLGAEHRLVANARTHLARILDAQAKYDEAERTQLEVLALREKLLGPEHPDVAYTLNYLAVINNHKEDFQSAVAYHERALAVRRRAFGEDHPIVAVSLINLGVVYDQLGDVTRARELYETALRVQEKTVGPNNVNFAVVLNNIGKIYNDLGEYKKAEPYLTRTVAILEKLFDADNPRIFDGLTNVAFSYVGQGRLDEAEALYHRIIESREKTVGPDHPLTAHALYNLGNLYALKSDYTKAEAHYLRALDIREKSLGPENPGVAGVLSAYALLLAARGDKEQALRMQQRASTIDEKNIALNLTIGSERQKIAFVKSLSDSTNQAISMQARFARDDPAAAELAASTVLRLKGRVMDAVSKNLVELRRRFNEEDRAVLDRFQRSGTKLAELIMEGPENGKMSDYQASVKSLTDERERLEDEISRRSAGLYVRAANVNTTSVGKLIPDAAALVEFAVYTPSEIDGGLPAWDVHEDRRYVAYVLRNSGKVGAVELGPAKTIELAVEAYRRVLRDPRAADTTSAGRHLDELVMQPVRKLLGDAKHLLISPDGDLNLIPFEAMVDENDKYLVERYAITYLSSGRDLLRLQAKRTSRSVPLVLADPDFDGLSAGVRASGTRGPGRSRRQSVTVTRSLSDTYFAPLNGTGREAREIKSLFTNARVLTRAGATETELKNAAAPSVLHLATHGFFITESRSAKGASMENPLLRSGLAFAGANQRRGDKDDGILTALEASGLDLWGTKLVVLSACDTGLGEVRTGEGVYGLRRSFTIAGAESLVMSMWPVSDQVTRELMTSYYTGLKNGAGRGESLRRTQLEMMKRPGRAHPFYWASFIQSGEWANLAGEREMPEPKAE